MSNVIPRGWPTGRPDRLLRLAARALRRLANAVLFRSRASTLIQLSPGLLILVALFALPLLFLAWVSLWRHSPNSFGPTPLTLENYRRFLFDGFFLRSILRTLQLGIVTTLVTLALGYPLALIMARSTARVRGFLLVLVLTPLMVSVVVRVFGWMVILGDTGLINKALLALGLIDQPLRIMNTMAAVVIGLAQVEFAFMVLPIFSALLGVGRSLEEAAATLGASPWRVFRHVVLPLSLPGVAAGSALVFSLSVSAFVQPQLLGGSSFFVMTTLMYQQITATLNWPFGAAIGFIILGTALLTLILLGVAMRKISPRRAGHAT